MAPAVIKQGLLPLLSSRQPWEDNHKDAPTIKMQRLRSREGKVTSPKGW